MRSAVLGSLLFLGACSPGRDVGPPVRTSGDFDPEVAALLSSLLADAEEDPADADPRGRLGMAYFAAGLRESALESFDQAARLDPDNARWWFHGAVVQSELGDLPGAVARMDEALARQPDYAPAWWRRGEWLLALGRFEDAGAAFRRSTELLPDHPGGSVGLARVALQEGRPDDAAGILSELLQGNPLPGFVPYIHQLLGTAYARSGRPELAKRHLSQGLAGRPEWSDRWSKEIDDYRVSLNDRIRFAVKAAKGNRPDRVLEILRPLRERYPDDPRILEHLGVAYFNVGRPREAREAFEALVRIDPENAFAYLHLSSVEEALGAPDRALELIRQAVDLNPRMARGQRRLGEMLERVGRDREALEAYQEAIRQDPKDPELLLAAGALALRLGESAEAAERFARVEELYPGAFTREIRELSQKP